MQLIAISNLHLRDPDASAKGAEHAARIARYLDRAAGICPSAVCYIVAGDLADDGDPVLDRIKLASPDSLARLLAKHKTVRQILFGHVHRTVFLTWNGIA